ncbi:MAG: acyclic terpene utilization AtuA family protein [Planctomycetota bacterium]
MRIALTRTFPPTRPATPPLLDDVDGLILAGDSVLPVDSPLMETCVVDALGSLGPSFFLSAGLTAVASLGGNFTSARATETIASRVGEKLAEAGCGELPLAAILGGSLLSDLESLWRAGATMPHVETGKPLAELEKPIVSAAVDLGQEALASALAAGARIVVSGYSVAPSLVAGLLRAEGGFDPAAVPPLSHALANRLVSGEGPVDVHAGDTAAADASKVLSGHCTALVRYVDQLCVSTVLRPTRSDVDAEWWDAKPDDVQRALGVAAASLDVQPLDRTGLPGVAVKIAASDPAEAHALERRLLVQFSPAADVGLTYDAAFPPTVHQELATWPTTVPAELLEWSIVTHTAAGWRDRG